MTQKKVIESSSWDSFLVDFTERNRGRRARFDIFEQSGNTAEEEQEGVFERISASGSTVTVERTYQDSGEQKTMTDEISGIHGIAVQLDTDGSEDTIEFMNTNGDLTQLHFESLVDGDS